MTSSVISLQSLVRQSSDQVSADMGGEVALLCIGSGKYHCLNETSSRIWQLIEQPKSVAEVCSILLNEFDVEPELCRQEVLAHLTQLEADKLIEVAHGAAA